MKKLLYIFIFTTILVSCRKHIYSTYYGNVDIDTLEILMYTEDDYPCYKVKVVEKDSVIIGDIVEYVPCPQQILYCPKKDCYYKLEPAPHETAVYDFDPTFNYHTN